MSSYTYCPWAQLIDLSLKTLQQNYNDLWGNQEHLQWRAFANAYKS